MANTTYKQMQAENEMLKKENRNLKDRLKRKSAEIKKIRKSGPDPALLKANVELQDELTDLKEKIKNGEEVLV